MTIRIFRDSVNPGLIPLDNTDGVMPYINGDYAWSLDAQQRFALAHKQLVRIDVIGNAPHQASILDVERGDATPQTARLWIPLRNAFRSDATIYIQRSNLDELIFETTGLDYWLIVADWTGIPHELEMVLPKGVRMAGTQFATLNNQFDATAIYADGWHPVHHQDWIPV